MSNDTRSTVAVQRGDAEPDLSLILAELSAIWDEDIKRAQSRCIEIVTEHAAYIASDESRINAWRASLTKAHVGPRGTKLITASAFNKLCRTARRTVSHSDESESAGSLYLIERGSSSYISNAEDMTDGAVCTPIIRSHVQGGVIYHAIEKVSNLLQPTTFYDAVVERIDGNHKGLNVTPSGRAVRYIIKWVTSRDAGGRFSAVWDGEISVPRSWLAYEISSSRRLTLMEWAKYAEVRTVNNMGKERAASIALMAMRQPEAKANWGDSCGFSTAPAVGPLKQYIFIKIDELKTEGKTIYGQGPYITDDGTRMFAAKSMIIDEHNVLHDDMDVDLSGLTAGLQYYDVTPSPDHDKVMKGIALFRRSYYELPTLMAIPAAMNGVLFSACLPALNPEWFSALQFSGMHGSGKTMYSQRLDAIQSREIRNIGKGSAARPVLNLGVTNGTAKGPSYRVKGYAGFFIASDDALKSGATDFQITAVSNIVSDMIRSLESGAAALGRVDRATNRVVSGEAGQLYSSLRITSELPFTGESTVERMIALPFLDKSWANGLFDTKLSRELSSPAAIDAMHHAWSAYVRWVFTHPNNVEDALSKACGETGTWETSARTQGNYAAALGGNYLFQEWCAEVYGIAVPEIDTDIVDALKACAEVQSVNATREDIGTVVVRALREGMADKRMCVVGESVSGAREWCIPFYTAETDSEPSEDDEEPLKEWPNPLGITASQIGLRMRGSSSWETNGPIVGYLKMPKPRGRGNQNGYVWLNTSALGTLKRVLVKAGLMNDCDDKSFKQQLIDSGVATDDRDGGPDNVRDRSLRITAERIWPIDESEEL